MVNPLISSTADPARWLDKTGKSLNLTYINISNGIFTGYKFNLKLPPAEKIPTDAEIDCNWGDGSNDLLLVNDQTIVDNVFTLEHSFPTNGEYNVTCRYLESVSYFVIQD